jgi:hypothetical protein
MSSPNGSLANLLVTRKSLTCPTPGRLWHATWDLPFLFHFAERMTGEWGANKKAGAERRRHESNKKAGAGSAPDGLERKAGAGKAPEMGSKNSLAANRRETIA